VSLPGAASTAALDEPCEFFGTLFAPRTLLSPWALQLGGVNWAWRLPHFYKETATWQLG
jgi:hypothetical protein